MYIITYVNTSLIKNTDASPDNPSMGSYKVSPIIYPQAFISKTN